MKLLAIAFLVCYSIHSLTEAGKNSRKGKGKGKGKARQVTRSDQNSTDESYEPWDHQVSDDLFDAYYALAHNDKKIHQKFGPDENGVISLAKLRDYLRRAGLDYRAIVKAGIRVGKTNLTEHDTGDFLYLLTDELTRQVEQKYLEGVASTDQQIEEMERRVTENVRALDLDGGNEGGQGSKGARKGTSRPKRN